jgi:hypothetical protein
MFSNRIPKHVITKIIHGLVLLFSPLYSSVECLKSDLRIRFSYEVIIFCVDLITTTHESRIYEVSSVCVEATRMVGTASALSIYLNINVALCCRWLWSKWVPSAYICSMHNIKNLNCYCIPVRRASVWLIIDWLNYAAGRQLKETSAWEPSFIQSPAHVFSSNTEALACRWLEKWRH